MNGEPDGKDELHLIPECILEFYVGVNRCPDAAVTGTLNNRGHDDWPEITYWPKKIYHNQTTGREFKGLGFSPEHPTLNTAEKKICEILGMKEWELATFLLNWTPTHSKEKYPQTKQVACKILGGQGAT